MPADVKGMKIRPADATIASFVTLLGGTNVQASAPEARDMIERGVADAITFPWGSMVLFGIDKVVKYHMDVPLYVTTFVWVMNKDKYEAMSPAQKKVIDDHCTTEWAEQGRRRPGPISRTAGRRQDEGRGRATRSYKLTPEQTRAVEARRPSRWQDAWADGVQEDRRRSRRGIAELKACSKYKPGAITVRIVAAAGSAAAALDPAGGADEARVDGPLHRCDRMDRGGSSSASSPPTSSSRCCCAISSTVSIPDCYDFGRFLLGILIFWGIAATSYRGTHITVDLVWAQCRPAIPAR